MNEGVDMIDVGGDLFICVHIVLYGLLFILALYQLF